MHLTAVESISSYNNVITEYWSNQNEDTTVPEDVEPCVRFLKVEQSKTVTLPLPQREIGDSHNWKIKTWQQACWSEIRRQQPKAWVAKFQRGASEGWEVADGDSQRPPVFCNKAKRTNDFIYVPAKFWFKDTNKIMCKLWLYVSDM